MHPVGLRRLESLDEDTCWDLVASVPVGRVAFVRDHGVVILPVNHAVYKQTVVFLTAVGSKLHAAWDDVEMTFEVDDYDPGTRTGWSVLVTGISEPVVDPVEVERLDDLGVAPWIDDEQREHWVRIRSYEVTGRRITGG